MFNPDNGIDYRLHRQYGFSNCRRLTKYFAHKVHARSVTGADDIRGSCQPQLAFGRQTMSVMFSFFGTMPRL